MTYNVFGGTLSLTQSVNRSCVLYILMRFSAACFRVICENGDISDSCAKQMLTRDVVELDKLSEVNGELLLDKTPAAAAAADQCPSLVSTTQ